jgi:uncharacterized membrane protein
MATRGLAMLEYWPWIYAGVSYVAVFFVFQAFVHRTDPDRDKVDEALCAGGLWLISPIVLPFLTILLVVCVASLLFRSR